MAKVIAPFLSISASGTFGGTLTAVQSRGQNIMRARTIPSNPQTKDQSDARRVLRVNGAIVTRVNLDQVGKADGVTMTPKEYFVSIRIAPNTWNSELLKRFYPEGKTTYDADAAAWEGLTAEQRTVWEGWNDAFANPFEDVAGAPGGSDASVAGQVAFSFARGLARSGYITTVPTGTPPTWDNTLKAKTRAELQKLRQNRGKKRSVGDAPFTEEQVAEATRNMIAASRATPPPTKPSASK